MLCKANIRVLRQLVNKSFKAATVILHMVEASVSNICQEPVILFEWNVLNIN